MSNSILQAHERVSLSVTLYDDLISRFEAWRFGYCRPAMFAGALALWLELSPEQQMHERSRYIQYESQLWKVKKAGRRATAFTTPTRLVRQMEAGSSRRRGSQAFRCEMGSALFFAVTREGIERKSQYGTFRSSKWDATDALDRWLGVPRVEQPREADPPPYIEPNPQAPVEMDVVARWQRWLVWYSRMGVQVMLVNERPVARDKQAHDIVLNVRQRCLEMYRDLPIGRQLTCLRDMQQTVIKNCPTQRGKPSESPRPDTTDDDTDPADWWKPPHKRSKRPSDYWDDGESWKGVDASNNEDEGDDDE